MKKILVYSMALILVATGCRKIEVDAPVVVTPGSTNENLVLEGKISADRTLKAGNVYKVKGITYVTGGATLTIEPGTIIQGEKASRGALVITRGAKIMAEGTKDKPIVFTSDAANSASGDWGGIVILGRAKTNATFNGQAGLGEIEGGVNNGEGLGLYGGTDDNDNSGILKFVRIEYAGYAFLPDKELNSLTLGSVGKATVIDHVQVTYALDDAIECFGGNVDLKHIITYKTLDDDFDTDNGYAGRIQWGIVMRDSARADISKVEGLESDNDANGSAATPQTNAVYSNMTIIGPRATASNVGSSLFLAAAQIRRNSSISVFNSVIMGWPTGVLIDASKGTPTDNNITAGSLSIQNTIIAGCAVPVDYSPSASAPTGWNRAAALAWFNTPAFGNAVLAANSDVKLADAFNYNNPDFTPQAGSSLLSGASFTSSRLSGFAATTYKGAVGAAGTPDGEWWKGWTRFN